MEPTPKDHQAEHDRDGDPLWRRTMEWLRRAWQPGESLSERVAQGGLWVPAMQIGNRLLTIARTIVLARLLTPRDFGLMGITALAMSTLDIPTRSGFKEALIQSRGAIEEHLDTAWTVSVIRGIVLCALLYLSAPTIASFFENSIAAPLMRAGSLCLLLDGLTNIGMVRLQRDLTFNKQLIYEMSSTVADAATGILAGFLLRSVWALILGRLARSLVGLVVSYLVHPYRPRLRLNWERARSLYGYGRWVVASRLLHFLFTEGDDAFVGKLLSASSLGLYQMAYKLSNLAAQETGEVVHRIAFPAFSRLQDQLDRLRDGYVQVLKVTSFLFVPIAGLVVVLGADLTMVFIGEKWMPMVGAMQVLALWGLIRSIVGTASPVLQAVGRPDLATKTLLARLVLLSALIYPLTVRWDILGTAMAVLFSAVPICLVTGYLTAGVLGRSIGWLGRYLVAPLLATTIACGGIMIVKSTVLGAGLGPFGRLLVLVPLAALVYAALVRFIASWLEIDYRMLPLLRARFAPLWLDGNAAVAEPGGGSQS